MDERNSEMDSDYTVNTQHRFQVIGADNNEIGTVIVYRRHGVLMLTDVWVHHEHRRKGIATRLMREAIQQFGSEPIYLHVHGYTNRPLSDAALIAWYSSFGFALIDGAPGMMWRDSTKE